MKELVWVNLDTLGLPREKVQETVCEFREQLKSVGYNKVLVTNASDICDIFEDCGEGYKNIVVRHMVNKNLQYNDAIENLKCLKKEIVELTDNEYNVIFLTDASSFTKITLLD
jgi:hypothetical protein